MKQSLTQALSKDNKEKPENKGFSDTLSLSKETTIEYKPDVLNIIWLSADGIGFCIAEQLIREGNNVIVGVVQEAEGEDGEAKRRRLSLFDGIIEKQPIDSLMKQMAKIENKDEWIVFCDFNSLAPYAEKALKLGFTKGFFPTEEDLLLEKDRDAAKEIVKEYYTDLTVAEVQEFKSVKDGVKFLEETEQIWVLKGNGDSAKTIVPWNDDPELAKVILIDALKDHTKDYEDGGFILEEKIIGALEITPQCVWLDGEVIFTDIDIENKPIGSGNRSVQTGAMQSLVFKSKKSDKINKLAFPQWIHDQAKKHKGLFVSDAGLLVKDDKYYFTEFCFQRFGYDSFLAELDMAGTATDFFTKLFNGKNPLKHDFGIATRGLNIHKDDKERRVLEGITMIIEAPNPTWLFEGKKEDEKIVCTGGAWDLVVFTGSGGSINEASHKAHEASEAFVFEDLYLRPEFDLLSFDYPTSIPNRYTGLNGKLFDAKHMEDMQEYETKSLLKEMRAKIDSYEEEK